MAAYAAHPDAGRVNEKTPMTAVASTVAGSSNGFSPPDTARESSDFSPLQSARMTSRSRFDDEFQTSHTSFSSSLAPSPRKESISDSRMKRSLNSARILRQAVDSQFRQRPAPLSSDWAGTGVQGQLQRRVKKSQSLVEEINKRVEGTEACIRKVKQMLSILSQNRQELEPGLKIVRRRLEIRSDRPADEILDDKFQKDLEYEKYIFDHSKKSLAQHIMGGSNLEEALTSAKTALIEDLLFKKNTMRLEKSALQFDPYHGRDRACVLPLVSQAGGSSSTTSPRDGPGDEPDNVMRSAAHTEELIARTQSLEETSGRFQKGGSQLIQAVKHEAHVASVATYESMRRNIAELFKQKKSLEQEVAQSQTDVNRTYQLLLSMQREIENQQISLAKWEDTPDIPLDMFDQRLPLSVQVDMKNTALGRMAEQAEHARKNMQTLERQCQETSTLLKQLESSHKELGASLESKSVAWQIDLACAKVALSGPNVGEKPSKAVKPPADSVLRVLVPRPLSEAAVNQIRSRIKAAAYTGPNGQGFDEIFGRFDKDGSGALEPEELRSALRRSLRIPEKVVSDQEISSLCGLLDSDHSGSISIQELVAFVGAEPLDGPRGKLTESLMKNLGLQATGGASFELDCLANSRHKLSQPMSTCLSNVPVRTTKDRRPLPKHVMDRLRASINAAAYAGHLGREVEGLFQRFDRDGSGLLEPEEVRLALRRSLKVPKSVINDDQIGRLCAQLDADDSGAISIPEIVAFLGKEPTVSKRTGKESIVVTQMKELQADTELSESQR